MGKKTYKQLLKYPDFLKVKKRSLALRRYGSDLVAIYYKEHKLIFKTTSATTKGVVWTQTIDVTDAALDKLEETKSFEDVRRLMLDSHLKIDCTCPAHHYYYKYVAWKNGYGLSKETRRPRIRNPWEVQSCCKHVWLVLQIYPFITNQIASRFRKYAAQHSNEIPKTQDSVQQSNPEEQLMNELQKELQNES